MDQSRKVGVFIDAENVAALHAAKIFHVAGQHGLVGERRIYGNLVSPHLQPWVQVAPQYALSLRPTMVGTAGKNSADIALAIDVAELLFRDELDVFCLATSDSDFTQLAMRIRQRGRVAIGLGKAAPKAILRMAFDAYTELGSPDARGSGRDGPGKAATAVERPQPDILRGVREAMVLVSRNGEGWADVSALGAALRRLKPDFRLKDWGAAKLSVALGNCPALEVRVQEGRGMQVRIRPVLALAKAMGE